MGWGLSRGGAYRGVGLITWGGAYHMGEAYHMVYQ